MKWICAIALSATILGFGVLVQAQQTCREGDTEWWASGANGQWYICHHGRWVPEYPYGPKSVQGSCEEGADYVVHMTCEKGQLVTTE